MIYYTQQFLNMFTNLFIYYCTGYEIIAFYIQCKNDLFWQALGYR